MTDAPLALPQPRRPRLSWTTRLNGEPGAVMQALAVVESADVEIVAREPTRMLLAWVDGDVMLRVEVVLHALADGVQLHAVAQARRPTRKFVTAVIETLLFLGLGALIRPDAAMRYMVFILGAASAANLYLSWRASTRARRAEFIALVTAIDRAVAPLRPVDERPFRALPAASTPAGRARK